MILSLTIAWCLLSVPVGIVLGRCVRLGLHGSELAVAQDAAAGDERRGADAPEVPQQRRPAAAAGQLQDV